MLTLTEIKSYLGITSTDYDDFLTIQESIISETVEGYCGRIFLEKDYVQTFYIADFLQESRKELTLFHYPLTELTTVIEKQDGVTIQDITSDVLPHNPTALLKKKFLSGSWPDFFCYGNEVEVTYSAGFAAVPGPIKSVILSLLEERYNKKLNGIQLNFGSDVQRISIPGTISIDFDYSLQANDRTTAFGTILGNYVNVLDFYRSERSIAGFGKIAYAEEV